MTILYEEFDFSHMQSFQTEKFYETILCAGDSIKTENSINTMAMSVGSSDSDSTSIATAASGKTTTTANTSTTKNTTSNRGTKTMGKRAGKRPGRKPAKIDERAKLERSRQSAKECRARKKLRYQYLEELVLNREKAVFTLREELEMFKQWCIQLDKGNLPEALVKMMGNEDMAKQRRQAEEMKRRTELQKQQLQQQLQQQQLYQRDLPSTSSTAGVYRISRKSPTPSPPSPSSSSSSSSSPSPPQISVHSNSHPHHQQQHQQQLRHPHPHHHQQPQQMSHSRLSPSVPPPPYPGVMRTHTSSTPMRHSLTRQMAFDESNNTMRPHTQPPPPLHHHHHPQQQQQHMLPHSLVSRQPQSAPQQHVSVPKSLTSLHGAGPSVSTSVSASTPISASAYPQQQNVYQFQKQSQPQDLNVFAKRNIISNTTTASTSPNQMDFNQRVRLHNTTPLQSNTVTSNVHTTTSSSIDAMPVSTLAYLDDISDLISKETTRNPTGQFTTASSSSTTNYSGISSTRSSITESRIRSVSNPTAMLNVNMTQQQQQQHHHFLQHPGQPRRSASFTNRNYPMVDTNMIDLTLTPTRKRHTTSDASLNTIQESHHQPTDQTTTKSGVGLFSGIPLAARNTTSSAISDGDSSDSTEEQQPNISGFFQSSTLASTSSPTPSQKRTLSDPDIYQKNKKARSLDSEMDSILTDSLLALYNDNNMNNEDRNSPSSYNPMSRLNSLTTMKCMGSTGTLNTPSAASPFGFAPRNTDSPMTTSSGVTSPVPSCHSGYTGSSPAPQASSFLETSNTSSTLSAAMVDQDLTDNTNLNTLMASTTPTNETFLFAPTTATSSPVVCSETGLSATISEVIPEWYSFLADLQADNTTMSIPTTPTTTPSFSLSTSAPKSNLSSQLSHFLHPVVYNQKQQPMTSSSTPEVLNVPSILEELSSEESA